MSLGLCHFCQQNRRKRVFMSISCFYLLYFICFIGISLLNPHYSNFGPTNYSLFISPILISYLSPYPFNHHMKITSLTPCIFLGIRRYVNTNKQKETEGILYYKIIWVDLSVILYRRGSNFVLTKG